MQEDCQYKIFCSQKAIYLFGEQKLCPKHAKGLEGISRLKKRKIPEKNEHPSFKEIVKKCKEQRSNGIGKLIYTRIKTVRKLRQKEGFITVIPDRWEFKVRDMIHSPELCPDALSNDTSKVFSNYFEAWKVFQKDLDFPEKYEELKKEFYISDIPLKREKIPLYIEHEGKKFSLIDSRYIFAKMYIKLIKEKRSYKEIKKYLQEGYNIQLTSFEDPEIREDASLEELLGLIENSGVEVSYILYLYISLKFDYDF